MERSAVVINTLPFNDIAQSSYPLVAPKSTARDISFSSFLRSHHSETSFEPPPSRLPHRVVITADDAELSIFDAEKYFNGTAEETTPASQPPSMERIGEKSDFGRPSSVSSVDGYGRNHKAAPFHAAPTASSEASWNSQSGLLSNPPGSMAISMRHIHLRNSKKCANSPRRWFFRRKCPCSGDKSVDVEEKSYSRQNGHTTNNSDSNCTSNNHHRKQNMGGADQEEPAKRPMVRISAEEWTKDESLTRGHRALSTEIGRRAAAARPFSDGGGFTFPILSHQMPTANAPDDPPRESLEVFRPPLILAAEEAMMAPGQAAAAPLYPGDVGRRSFNFATSPRRRGEDDVASDSSSDLFEIESFSTSTGGGGASAAAVYRRRDALDELVRSGAGQAPYRYSLDETSTTITSLGAEAYEASEVSVEWSVATAEGFDRGSVANFSASASEFGETRLTDLPEVGDRATTTLGGGGGGKKKGGFLSCRCEKAVSVGPQPVKQPGTGPVGHSTLSTDRHHQHDDEEVDDDDTSIIHINKNKKNHMPIELGREASLMASLAVHGGRRPLHVNAKPHLPRSNSARLGARPFNPR